LIYKTVETIKTNADIQTTIESNFVQFSKLTDMLCVKKFYKFHYDI